MLGPNKEWLSAAHFEISPSFQQQQPNHFPTDGYNTLGKKKRKSITYTKNY
jgi:hypothetical protein